MSMYIHSLEQKLASMTAERDALKAANGELLSALESCREALIRQMTQKGIVREMAETQWYVQQAKAALAKHRATESPAKP